MPLTKKLKGLIPTHKMTPLSIQALVMLCSSISIKQTETFGPEGG